jgi:hypothetical protein
MFIRSRSSGASADPNLKVQTVRRIAGDRAEQDTVMSCRAKAVNAAPTMASSDAGESSVRGRPGCIRCVGAFIGTSMTQSSSVN